MYFGMSLGRVNVDFRGLLPPIFERHVRGSKCECACLYAHSLRQIYQMFSSGIASVVHRFIEQLKLHKWSTGTPPMPPVLCDLGTRP